MGQVIFFLGKQLLKLTVSDPGFKQIILELNHKAIYEICLPKGHAEIQV